MQKRFKTYLTCFLCAALFMIWAPSRGQELDMSIRTNVLWDALSEPNIGLEFPVSNRWSVGGNLGLKAWPRYLAWDWDNNNPTHLRNFAVVPEVRYYFDQVYQGWFVGADALYTHFNVGAIDIPLYPEVKEFREQGAFWAGGLFAGYAWWPWQHWRIELEAGAAVGLASYGKYDCAHCGTKVGEERKVAVVPKLAVNVAYNTVPRDREKAKRARQWVVSGTDTITVMTPPVVFTVHLRDIMSPQTVGDSLSKVKTWVTPIQNYRPLDYLTRPGRDSVMFVKFPLDSWELRTDMGSNGAVLDELSDAIGKIRDDQRTNELLVSIVGLASIEGPQERNDTLSVNRAKVVADYLNQSTGVSRRFFETIGKGEAWDWFKAQLEASPDGHEKLLDIIYNEEDPDARERQIKADKALYKDVKDNFLADQRNSGYIRVYYNNAPDQITEDYNNQIMPLLRAKRYHQAVKKFESNPSYKERALQDAQAANAYGIALYFTALDNRDLEAENEAVEFVKQAAANGSEEAVQNLKGMEVYGPARKEFEAWQEAMKEK